MTELPEPLTPPDCDLRGMEWMPLYGSRLLASETWLSASPEGRVAALALWWAAWQQRPAGSLADDDRILAQLAGYGFAVDQWRAIRPQALRGWVKCSDGRLYHPVVAELAVDAYARRCKDAERRAGDRDRLARWRERQKAQRDHVEDETPDGCGDDTGCGNADETRFETHDETGTKRDRQDRTGQERKKEPPSLRDVPPSSASGDPPSPPKAKRRQEVPEDWRPSDRDLNFAACHIDRDDLEREIAQFVDHHRSRGTVFRDVSRGWQTWCRNHSAWKRRRGPPRDERPSKLAWMLDDDPRETAPTISPDGYTLQ